MKTTMTHQDAERLLQAACDFQGHAKEARQNCREQYRAKEASKESSLRVLIDGQIALLPDKLATKVDATDDRISYQIGVSASFVRTHFLVSDLILDGDLVEAVVLIRKQLESLARLHELDSKPLQKLTGNVPNIQNILKGSPARMYGDLSEVAHMSTPRAVELLTIEEREELVGPSLLPTYSEQSAACSDMNSFVAIYFLGWMAEKLPTLYSGYDNSDDQRLLKLTAALALDCGVIRLPESSREHAAEASEAAKPTI